MKLDPERILKAYEEYKELECREAELYFRACECAKGIETVLGIADINTGLAGTIRAHIVESILIGKKVTVEDIRRLTVSTLERWLKDNWGNPLVPVPHKQYVDMLLCNDAKEIKKLFEENKETIETIIMKLEEIIREWKEIEKRKKEIFGVQRWDELSLKNLITMIYKCLKLSIVE